ncbi:MAG: cupredoxin domain-containing protein [Chloroflexi bacterium]|nr:cupredoxin domain-containing protein [Chloroflexota bacterium]
MATAAPTAAPTPFAGRTLEISATNNVFSIKDVEVAAGQDFEITFKNNDDGSHAIYVTEGVRPIVMQSLDDYRNGPYPFKGEYIKGPSASTTYHVAALAAGAYQFFCPPHRDMVISLTVK